MMLPPQGPTSSLMEDFNALGIIESKSGPDEKVKQVKQDDKKGGDYAGPPGDKNPDDPGGDVDLAGDEAAGHYTYVPVRGDEDVSPTGKYGKSRGGAKNEDVEEVATSNKMIPSFMIPPTPTADEIAEAEVAEAEAASKAQLDRAWDVINAYFSEDVDGLNEEGLRGVINAMGYALDVAVEDIANLHGENVRLTEAVNDLNRLLKEADDEKAEDEDEDEGDDEGEEEEEEKEKKLPFGGKQALPFGKKEESRRGGNLMEDASLNSILDEVAAIGGSSKQQALSAQSRLIEAFEEVAETASEIVNKIADVIRSDEGISEDEDIELAEDDERGQVADFFESIYNDAEAYLGRLADGNVAFRVAEEDLNRLRADIQQGIDAMHNISA